MKDYKGIILVSLVFVFAICLIQFGSAEVVSSGIKSYYLDGSTNYTIYNLSSNGYFNTTSAITISILMIAGGGGGSAGGGGAGGLINYTYVLPAGNYVTIIGQGGVGSVSTTATAGGNGTNTSFNNYVAIGGGGGGSQANLRGYNGGSGGGGTWDSGGNGLGGIATSGQGYDGGYKLHSSSPFPAAGGGGAGGLGGNTTAINGAGIGGIGKYNNIFNGTLLCYAGGGGGSFYQSSAGSGGTANCGGGNGNLAGGSGSNAIDGTGGGGGGGANSASGGSGGDGIIIIKFTENMIENSINYTSVIYETESGQDLYALNISLLGSYVPTNAYLIYNGTNYSATITNLSGFYIINKTTALNWNNINMGSSNFYYTFNISSTESVNTTTYTQTKSAIQMGLCNATLTIPYLNISFKNEETLGYIKASIPSSTFVYYLGDGTINKTLTFVNTTANYLYTFCMSPTNKTYYIKPYVQYKNDTSYPQRIWDDVVRSYTNATTNKTLYLLDATQGIYVTYQTLDGIGNQLSGVQATVNRTIEGSAYVVGTGLTDSSGAITFWLNPDFVHSLSFDKSGYSSFYLSHFPTQTAYTVTLGQSSSSELNDYIRGITYTFLPNAGITLNASQLYNFNLTLNSTYWNISSFGFILYGDGIVIGGNSSTTSGSFIYNVLNISNYTHVSEKIYWVINGTTIYGINNGWFVFDYTEGTGWSIGNFFKDLKNYTSPTYHPETDSYTGIFGLNADSLNFIIFVIIFLTTGLVSYKFSFTSPTVVTGIIFGLTFLFDVGLGLITMPILSVVHFPTIFMLLIVVASAVWEVRR